MDSREIGRLRQKCFSFSRTLLAYKRDFRFSLRVGSFEMSLGADGASGRKAGPGCGRKRNPAYFRRQKRRRQAFLEKRGLASDSLGTGAETVVGGTRDGEGDEEVGGREQEQKEEVTLEDVCRLAVELSEINNQRSCEISELLNDTKNLLNSWTANQTSDDEEDDGEQGDDENDLLVLFDSLGKQLKTFQRDLTSTDKKVENAKKTSSPLRKKGGNDVSCLNNPCL